MTYPRRTKSSNWLMRSHTSEKHLGVEPVGCLRRAGAGGPDGRDRDLPVSANDDQPPVRNADKAIYGPYFIGNFATKLCVDLPGNGGVATSGCSRLPRPSAR